MVQQLFQLLRTNSCRSASWPLVALTLLIQAACGTWTDGSDGPKIAQVSQGRKTRKPPPSAMDRPRLHLD